MLEVNEVPADVVALRRLADFLAKNGFMRWTHLNCASLHSLIARSLMYVYVCMCFVYGPPAPTRSCSSKSASRLPRPLAPMQHLTSVINYIHLFVLFLLVHAECDCLFDTKLNE